MAADQLYLYEPYFGYDDDDDRTAAEKLRQYAELLSGRHDGLAASILRNARTYERLRPTNEGEREAVEATLDELLAGLPDYDDNHPTKRQGMIAITTPPPVPDPPSDPGTTATEPPA
jgi:hypothetical protein